MKYLFLPVTVLGALLLPGCVSFDPAEARQDQTSQFSHTLEMRAQDFLTRPLTLDDCLRIAMTNNYDIRLAELDKLIGSFDTQLAFSAFLPQVSASVNYLSYRKDPVQTSKNYAYGSGDLGWSVFMPSTWFLYDAAKHAQEAAALAADYTRQTIVLQTTAAFYDVRVQGLAEEGYARPWERDQALQIKEAREAELASARRQLVVLKGNLLQLLGFSPLAPVELSAEDEPLEPFDADDETLVLTALSVHPSLSIADRQVVIGESQVREAFCNFLPTLRLFGTWSFTGNDVMSIPANNLSAGFAGAWNIFSGFANHARYKTAKAEREKSELAREQTFLSIMASVVSAHAAVLDAAADAALTRRAYEVAVGKAEDLDARAREGLTPINEALDAAAERVRKIKPELLMIEESERHSATEKTYDATYEVLWQRRTIEVFHDKKPAKILRERWESFDKEQPKNARVLRAMENHDFANGPFRKRCEIRFGYRGMDAVMVMNFTLDGIPFIYSGNEFADDAPMTIFSDRTHGRYFTEWANMFTEQGKRRMALVKKLIELRKDPVFYDGKTRWLDNDKPDAVLSYTRESKEGAAFVAINASDKCISTTVDADFGGSSELLSYGAKCESDNGKTKLELQPKGYIVLRKSAENRKPKVLRRNRAPIM